MIDRISATDIKDDCIEQIRLDDDGEDDEVTMIKTTAKRSDCNGYKLRELDSDSNVNLLAVKVSGDVSSAEICIGDKDFGA